MKKGPAQCAVVALWIVSAAIALAQTAQAVQAPIIVNVETRQTAEPISQYGCGMFIEHMGSLIYSSLWPEMLDDRKFYCPISPKETNALGRMSGPFRNLQQRRWHRVLGNCSPVGPISVNIYRFPFVAAQ